MSVSRAPASRLSAAFALRGAALCALGMAAIWVLAALVPVAHWRDAVVLDDFTQLSRPGVDGPASTLLHLLDPLLYTIWALLIVAVALLRRRPRVALAVAVVLPAAPLAAELIKPLAAHPARRDRLPVDQRRVLAQRSRDRRDDARAVRAARRPAPAAPDDRRARRPRSRSPSASRC